MIGLVLGYHNVDVNSAPQLTVPVAVDQFGSYIYEGGELRGHRVPGRAAGPPHRRPVPRPQVGATTDTYSGGALPSPSTVTVSVLNGSGAYNQATDTAQSLQALGFHIGTIGDSPPVGQEAETVVYYASKTPAELAAAQAVANSMSGAVIMADGPDPGEARLAGHRRHGHRLHASTRPPPRTTTTAPAGRGRAQHDADAPRATTANIGEHGQLRRLPGPDADASSRSRPGTPARAPPSGGEGT